MRKVHKRVCVGRRRNSIHSQSLLMTCCWEAQNLCMALISLWVRAAEPQGLTDDDGGVYLRGGSPLALAPLLSKNPNSRLLFSMRYRKHFF